jgi:hypothetical protein
LDLEEARQDLDNAAARRDRENLYGVPLDDLGSAGPSVVSINGVIASLGVTEFAVAVSQLRRPHSLLTYRGDLGRVTANIDSPPSECYYCKEVYGMGESAGLERYLVDDRRTSGA